MAEKLNSVLKVTRNIHDHKYLAKTVFAKETIRLHLISPQRGTYNFNFNHAEQQTKGEGWWEFSIYSIRVRFVSEVWANMDFVIHSSSVIECQSMNFGEFRTLFDSWSCEGFAFQRILFSNFLNLIKSVSSSNPFRLVK